MADRISQGCAIGIHPWDRWRAEGQRYTRQCTDCGKTETRVGNPEPPVRKPFDPYADL